jgi:glycosyltransferase involved in cell wall biosynthesis
MADPGSRALLERAARLREMRLPRAIYRRIASRPFAKESDAIAQIEARERAVRSMFDSVDLFVSPSHFLKERFVEEGLAADRILVSDNGFDMTSWRSFKRTPRGDGAPIRFAYLGTWIPSKGVHVLLEAFRELDPKRAVLEIHGYAVPFDGFESYPDQLMALAENAPHIRLGNRYEPADVPQLLAEADALIIPSLWYENSPLTIHEAFLAGLPVIAAAHGGQQEFVKALGPDACFKPASVRSLRATLQRLINEPTRLDAMRERVPVVKEIRANAVELEALYPG